MRYSEQSKRGQQQRHERTSERSLYGSRPMPGLFRTLQPISPVSLARRLIMYDIEK
jgi:hypothetical protein